MCGIGGILTRRSDLDLHEVCDRLLQGLRHRGPDDQGIERFDLAHGVRLGLVHTRLAIQDLSPAGHQPMHDKQSDLWIAFNGEIYNHRDLRKELPGEYRSTSDTETILRAWATWGPAAIDRIRGMFAWALFDARQQRLHLVRDRLGIKPLYACRADNDTWLFASEIRPLLDTGLVPRRLSRQALDNYLGFGAVNAPRTMVENIVSLQAAEHWELGWDQHEFAAPKQRRYWTIPWAPSTNTCHFDEAVERVRPVLRQAIDQHMLSDVPVGVFLSGGIDSSSLVAELSSVGRKPQTFSVFFGERAFDESAHAAEVARSFGTEHHPLKLSPESLVDDFYSALAAYDQPSIDGVNTFLISQAVAKAGIRVALSGLGGDELFAGYDSFGVVERFEYAPYQALAQVASLLLMVTRPGWQRTEKLRALVTGAGSRIERYSILRQVMSTDLRHALLGANSHNDIITLPAGRVAELMRETQNCDAINSQSCFELSAYVGDMLLRDADQMSMVHPVEIRVPLLDHVLIETLAAIPGKLKLHGPSRHVSKQLLIDALPTRLPPSITQRPKMGFVFPWELWLRKELAEHVTWILTDWKALHDTGLDELEVQRLWKDFRRGQAGIRYTDILALIHLLHWARRHRLSI